MPAKKIRGEETGKKIIASGSRDGSHVTVISKKVAATSSNAQLHSSSGHDIAATIAPSASVSLRFSRVSFSFRSPPLHPLPRRA